MSDPSNSTIAAALAELGDLYELDGAVVHRVVAYRNAAKAVRASPVSVAALARAGRATELPGIGATLQEKIMALVETGTIPAAEKLRARFGPGLLELTALPGLGPKRARRLFDELGIDSLEALRTAAAQQRLRDLRGFGQKFERSVLEALERGVPERVRDRTLLHEALGAGELLLAGLRERDPKARIELAGSLRRRTETVKDIDVVVASDDPDPVLAGLGELAAIEAASTSSARAARGVTHTGLAVEVRAVDPDQFGSLLQHFTGSAGHNAALRERAVRAGLHVSEYGITRAGGAAPQRCASEEEVYGLLGLAYIEPELREHRGELAAAAAGGRLPKLIEVGDLRGDLHCHTVASDGKATVEEMAHAALELGYEYLAITDHSASHGFGNHVSPDELRRQIERIHLIDARLDGIRVLAGSEVNILPDGSPDYEDELLAELDWAIGSVHTAFSMTGDAMTERIMRAMQHPLIDAIGHPTGRLILRREPYDVDMAALIECARETGTLLEINANPNRRDLDELNARAASDAGALLVINSDGHRPESLRFIRYGVWTARRAWVQPQSVANTLSWQKLSRRIKRGRR